MKTQVADEFGLLAEWATRLHGETLSELRADASRLAKTLGVAETEPARDRDEGGRFSGDAGMNEAIRAARGTVVPAAMRELEPVDGVLGAGRGGTNPPRRPVSARIREASGR